MVEESSDLRSIASLSPVDIGTILVSFLLFAAALDGDVAAPLGDDGMAPLSGDGREGPGQSRVSSA
jgi:hypothetical protein